MPSTFADNVDRSDPNFVKASLLWIGPGNEFFGCAGHSSIRLECPTYKLDNCFSCESEGIRDNFWKFFTGKLKAGMFAIPTSDFLQVYASYERGCRQYPLNLPPDVKQRLWKILDDQVAKGYDLPYDYIKYCCVQTMLQPLLEAIRPHQLKTAPWPEIYKKTRREILAEDLAWCPWTRIFLHMISGTEVDREVSPFKTVILSRDFVELLRTATIDGVPIITSEPETLLSSPNPKKTAIITPVMVASLMLALSIVNFFVSVPWISWLFLLVQTAIGALLVHLVCFSTLPATDWNWLLIPFNPLPLVFWKWRAKWALCFVLVIVGWLGFMILSPHKLTDTAFLLLAGATALVYVRESTLVNHFLHANQKR